MPIRFSAEEIVELAVRIEKNGRSFYGVQAEKAEGELKELFTMLAKDEGQHIEDFKELLAGAGEGFSYSDETADRYLAALADSQVFAEEYIKELISEASAVEELIHCAIMMEKESLVFYYGMLEVANERARSVVEEIIEQEKGHIRRLSRFVD